MYIHVYTMWSGFQMTAPARDGLHCHAYGEPARCRARAHTRVDRLGGLGAAIRPPLRVHGLTARRQVASSSSEVGLGPRSSTISKLGGYYVRLKHLSSIIHIMSNYVKLCHYIWNPRTLDKNDDFCIY